MSLNAETLVAAAAGLFFGIVGFAPMFAVEHLVRKRKVRPTIGKGMAAIAVSFIFFMAGLAVVWVYTPRMLLVMTAGALLGFFAALAVLAARSMSR